MNHVIIATQPNVPTVLYPTPINSQLIHNLTNLNSLIMTHTSVNLDLHVAKNQKFKLCGIRISLGHYSTFQLQLYPYPQLRMIPLTQPLHLTVFDQLTVSKSLNKRKHQTKKTCGIAVSAKSTFKQPKLWRSSKYLGF